jgi:hypothetical protein
MFGHNHFTEKGLFVYLSSFLEKAITCFSSFSVIPGCLLLLAQLQRVFFPGGAPGVQTAEAQAPGWK